MKRIFAAALAACLMLLAAGAMAQGHGSDWKTITQSYCDSLDNGTLSSGKYCLGEDVACDFEIRKGATVTLCLCGHTISSAVQDTICNEGSLTLEDCSAAKGGNVWSKYFGVYNKGVFTMNSGAIESEYGGVYNDAGKFILNDGSVEGSMGVYMKTARDASQSGMFIMNGGKVKSNGYGVICETDEENAHGAYSQFAMNAGTITGSYFGVLNLSGKLSISEGTIGGGMYAVVEEERRPLEESDAEEKYIAEGSYKESGAFGGKQVVIKKIPVVAPELPKTGDSSMLLGWVALLGAAGAGMKLRRRG